LSQSTGFLAAFGAGLAVGLAAGCEVVVFDAATEVLLAAWTAAGELAAGAAALGAVLVKLAVFLALGVGFSSCADEFAPRMTMKPTRPAITINATPPIAQASLEPELAGAAADICGICGGMGAPAIPPAIGV